MKSIPVPVPGILFSCAFARKFRQSPATLQSKQSGFSLLEALTSVSIAGILGVMATSSGAMLQSHATVAELNGLMADFAYARTHAIKRQKTITVCASADGVNCDRDSQWNLGWIIFTDEDRDRLRDAGDQLLRVQGQLRKQTRISQGSGYYYYVMYRPTGMAYPNATFTFCHGPHYRRAIIVFRSGRSRVSTLSSAGDSLECEVS